jgi:S-formylglutathione hydrolase FrmB
VRVCRVDVPSAVLGTRTAVSAALPGSSPPSGVLYLLHGLGEDDGAWLRRSAVGELAEGRALALVMPFLGASFGVDEAHGRAYGTFLARELADLVQRHLGLSAPSGRTFVAGVSMGGYAAVRWALTTPARFAAAASLSGSLDIADPERYRRRPQLMARLFGDRPAAGSADDLLALAALRAEPGPALYVACGRDDAGHLAEAGRFVAAARTAGRDVTLDVGPGGHDWAYWDAAIRRVLAWLPLP